MGEESEIRWWKAVNRPGVPGQAFDEDEWERRVVLVAR